ncbi:hypothetical protein [Streptomyces sp. 7N604]|uniref:hypothetical protein n=1 Tax=Streptomyces sp. 7N604 TaxID=3457415 RepID=UPI003FD663E1
MAVAAIAKKPNTPHTPPPTTKHTTKPTIEPFEPLKKKPLPTGQPREWYESHNRKLKAMRLAIALLDTGVYRTEQAPNSTIRTTAARIGIHPPSNTTCRLVRSLIRDGR